MKVTRKRNLIVEKSYETNEVDRHIFSNKADTQNFGRLIQ